MGVCLLGVVGRMIMMRPASWARVHSGMYFTPVYDFALTYMQRGSQSQTPRVG